MEIVLCLIIPLVAAVTLVAIFIGYKMGKGEVNVFMVPKTKAKDTGDKRKKAIIAGNIERYDGTPNGQQEVK